MEHSPIHPLSIPASFRARGHRGLRDNTWKHKPAKHLDQSDLLTFTAACEASY